jgi:hypothetical protein
MRLPVSGFEVRFRVPDGNDDLAILEAAGNVVERALAVLPRLALFAADARWEALTVTDFEFGLLELRRFLLGDRVSCDFRCARCEERMEVEFSIEAFLSDIEPKMPCGVRPNEARPGWYLLDGSLETSFRLIEVRDQEKVLGQRDAAHLLTQLCIEPHDGNARSLAHRLARVVRSMEAMAPAVSRPVAGVCAACDAPVTMPLHVPRLVMDELRMAASGVHQQTHAIAEAYHWDEASILAMPQARRQAYVEMIRQVAV